MDDLSTMRLPRGGRPGGTAPRVPLIVDARALHSSGIGRYLREVLRRMFADPRFSRFVLLAPPAEVSDFVSSHRGEADVTITPYPSGFYNPLAQLAWLGLRARGVLGGAPAFFPHFDAPAAALPRGSVVTVQDLIHFKVPSAFPASRRWMAGGVLRRVVSGAERVIVTSESTRRDLLDRLPSAAAKIDVCSLGVDAFFSPPDATFRRPLEAPYLLCVGNRKRHKNLETAVRALALLAPESPDLRLVVAGPTYPDWAAVRALAGTLGVSDRVIERHDANDAELRDLYRGCEALLFLSLYEGFGLPVLEAMACGAPVVASDRASVPEVVGDAGLLVPATDARAVADAVIRVRVTPELRRRLGTQGVERARAFAWTGAAACVADVVYRTAVAAGWGR